MLKPCLMDIVLVYVLVPYLVCALTLKILQSFVVMNMVLGTDTVKLVDCGSCFFLVNNGRLNS